MSFWVFDSFDIVRDTLGLVRTEFPHTMYLMAGTQVSFIYFFIINLEAVTICFITNQMTEKLIFCAVDR